MGQLVQPTAMQTLRHQMLIFSLAQVAVAEAVVEVAAVLILVAREQEAMVAIQAQEALVATPVES